jgi:putative transposase
MPGTFTQIYLQIVFAVKHRQRLIMNEWKSDLHKYMAGTIQARGHKSIIVNGVSDHVHLFVGLKPVENISTLVREIKNNSTNFINSHGLSKVRFSWQEGYGAFSYSKSDIHNVYQYILNQEAHHKKISFKEEYIGLLREHGIEYDEKFLFDAELV